MGRIRSLWVLVGLVLFTVSVYDFHVSADVIPSENECRPYIEKAIHELKNVEATGSDDDKDSTEANLDENASIDSAPETGADDDGNDSKEENADKSAEDGSDDENQSDDNEPSQENQTEENASVEEPAAEKETVEDLTQENESNQQDDSKEQNETVEDNADEKSAENDSDEPQANDAESLEKPDSDIDGDSKEEAAADADSKEETADADSKEGDSQENDDNDSKENAPEDGNDSKENDSKENDAADESNDSTQTGENQESTEQAESDQANDDGSNEESTENQTEQAQTESVEDGNNVTAEDQADSKEDEANTVEANDDSTEEPTAADNESQEGQNDTNEEESTEETVRAKRSLPDEAETAQSDEQESTQNDDNDSLENANNDSVAESQENAAEGQEDGSESQENAEASQEGSDQESEEAEEEVEQEPQPEEDLTMEFEIPKNLRNREHVSDLLGLDAASSVKENALKRTGDVILKELKRVFDNAVHPLEATYKYRDLSNRHFGDPEIFSKPLVLFMGPWSGGKSTILNYLTDNEYTPNSIRSGAEPSPAYFNILMHGDEPEVLDGTQLAADWTFSGLQKFGQGLMDRLRGQKLPSKLLERVNIVEIPGILEVRKQVSKYFPFNDACQWFIDRADIIFLVYDPSKLDVGPETEAILDQLKGREYQTRILLNKADQVKPEELLRVQGALIWNISPLMSSAQPPVMYTVSLWSHPFANGAPIRLLQAQERAFLTDLREAIDRRIENKIASARRFAVRIRNHAKMVDCYLTTYYNQKGLFSNKKQVADKIIEHPQNYNIYEGLSTLTNISRYDLPDPDVYLDFFRLNPLYEFKKLAETCTYFKGCPINKLDIAIAYDLPELVGKYKKLQEQNLLQMRKEYDDNCNQTEIDPPVKIIKSR